MYWLRRRLLSQNFFSNRELISKLIRGSSISPTDTVLDIGAGEGTITQELLKITPHVIAIEKDPTLTATPQDFLLFNLPTYPYKVFANIPFSITSDIIRKLLSSPNPPSDCYLIVQSETANKFKINPKTNTMAALLYYPWWDIQITHNFNRSDFHPKPKVDSVLLHIQPRSKPLLNPLLRPQFYDYITYHFIHNPQAKFISPSHWPNSNFPKYITGAYSKLLDQQSHLHKIHRTRTDKNWKKFS